MLRKIVLNKESTLTNDQIYCVNSVLTSLYNKLTRVFTQDRVTEEPKSENVGLPVGSTYNYVGKRFNEKYYYSFDLDVTSYTVGYGHIVVKDIPEYVDIYALSTNMYNQSLRGSFQISKRNANSIDIVYVPYREQKGTFKVSITGSTK